MSKFVFLYFTSFFKKKTVDGFFAKVNYSKRVNSMQVIVEAMVIRN